MVGFHLFALSGINLSPTRLTHLAFVPVWLPARFPTKPVPSSYKRIVIHHNRIARSQCEVTFSCQRTRRNENICPRLPCHFCSPHAAITSKGFSFCTNLYETLVKSLFASFPSSGLTRPGKTCEYNFVCSPTQGSSGMAFC